MSKPAHLALGVRGSHGYSGQAAPQQQHASFGGIGGSMDTAADPDYIAIAHSREFQELRSRVRKFVFPMSALFLAHYLAFVFAAAYMPELLGTSVLGAINLGLVLGIAQFASTILVTAAYLRFATRRVDPMVKAIRQANGVHA